MNMQPKRTKRSFAHGSQSLLTERLYRSMLFSIGRPRDNAHDAREARVIRNWVARGARSGCIDELAGRRTPGEFAVNPDGFGYR